MRLDKITRIVFYLVLMAFTSCLTKPAPPKISDNTSSGQGNGDSSGEGTSSRHTVHAMCSGCFPHSEVSGKKAYSCKITNCGEKKNEQHEIVVFKHDGNAQENQQSQAQVCAMHEDVAKVRCELSWENKNQNVNFTWHGNSFQMSYLAGGGELCVVTDTSSKGTHNNMPSYDVETRIKKGSCSEHTGKYKFSLRFTRFP